mmetsp:Transcript_84302/g.153929  ORF Transcript_84302/g.153929 Transcript_84302/m.153929 type:complete len:105 (-) Transcript_84302:15-329(-)
MDSTKRRLLTPERDAGSLAAGVAAADALKNVLNGALPTSKWEEAEQPTGLSKVALKQVPPVMRRVTSRSQSPKAPSRRNASAARRDSGGSLQWRAMHAVRGKHQ